jgi:hypothetical protein
MKRVWKYEITNAEVQIPIPATDVKPLFVLTQRNHFGNGIFVWVELTPDKDMQRTPVYTFYLIMTGQELPNGVEYIGSCQDPANMQIYHIYWRKPENFITDEDIEM